MQPVPSDVTADDLVAAVRASEERNDRRDWGEAILNALEDVAQGRPSVRGWSATMLVLKDAAEHYRRGSTPFDGMLEAPRQVADVYQNHAEAVRDLADVRAQLLEDIMVDLADHLVSDLGGVEWKELVARGATFDRPPVPVDPWLDM